MPSFSKPLEDSPLVDLLDEDPTISGQKFACVSFISPENVLKNKNLFLFEEFLKKFDFTKSMEKYEQFLQFLIYKYGLEQESIMNDFKGFIAEEKNNLLKTSMEDEYKNFVDANEEQLNSIFNEKHNFQTSVRGLKVRGTFESQTEAENQCKKLRDIDPNHDIYVGPVGIWMPFEPEAYKTGRVEHLNDDLNKLMHNKKTNEQDAKIEFEKRVREAKEKAMEENQALAEKTGNKLSQTMDEEGNLINTLQVNYDEIADEDVILPEEMKEKSASANIRKELFESSNVSTSITSPATSPSRSTNRKSPTEKDLLDGGFAKLDENDPNDSK